MPSELSALIGHHEMHSPLEALAAELGADVGRIERECRMRVDGGITEMRLASAALAHELTERVTARLAEVRDGERGPPGETPALDVPDDIAPMIARAIALLAEAPPLAAPQPAPAVVNVNLPAPRTERSRVKHDAQGRVVEIERDIA